jgi:hypothetical protein
VSVSVSVCVCGVLRAGDGRMDAWMVLLLIVRCMSYLSAVRYLLHAAVRCMPTAACCRSSLAWYGVCRMLPSIACYPFSGGTDEARADLLARVVRCHLRHQRLERRVQVCLAYTRHAMSTPWRDGMRSACRMGRCCVDRELRTARGQEVCVTGVCGVSAGACDRVWLRTLVATLALIGDVLGISALVRVQLSQSARDSATRTGVGGGPGQAIAKAPVSRVCESGGACARAGVVGEWVSG